MNSLYKAIVTNFFSLVLITSCSPKIVETGRASYYADKFEGRKTANGEIFSQDKMTAASKNLPFGTKVTVKNITNGRTVKVRVNDRGPFVAGRTIDLSKKAAQKINMVDAGVADVVLRYRLKK
ncbi:MAG: septal ring lytic transglycosylase RlpA family protein [Segetibacter sp.]|nr:septal ring lytic transglycosylase RlpA family protein [Segetibacter sp.]